VAQGGHPSNAYVSTQSATNLAGIWSKVLSDTKVQEVRFGFNNFDWSRTPEEGQGTIEYDFSGLTVGKPYNYPQLFHQNNFESRYDLSLHKNTHDIKVGGEFIYVTNKGDWFIQQVGRMIFNSNPANMNSIIAGVDPSTWNIAAIPSSVVREFDQNFHPSDWGINVPRPTWALWVGDNWRATSQLTLNYGVRWDVDWGVASPPDVVTNSIAINNNAGTSGKDLPGMTGTDFGFKDGIRDNKNIAPRAGFTYNVNGKERSRHPRWHRSVLHDPRVEHDVQPADLQSDGHRGVPAAGQRQVSRWIALDDEPGVRRGDLRAGEGGCTRAVPPHHQPRLQESIHLAEQHRLPEADQPGDRVRARRDALQRVPRHAHGRSESFLQPGDRLQPETRQR